MEVVIGFIILGAIVYFSIVIFIAILRGFANAGKGILSSWPAFFSKIWNSILTGLVAGMVISVFTGGNAELAEASALGSSIIRFLFELFHES